MTAWWLGGHAVTAGDHMSVGQYVAFAIHDYSAAEVHDFFPRTEPTADAHIETHNYLPGAKDDTNLYGFMMIQFDWGKRLVTFYSHPSTDNKGGRATKNTMGR